MNSKRVFTIDLLKCQNSEERNKIIEEAMNVYVNSFQQGISPIAEPDIPFAIAALGVLKTYLEKSMPEAIPMAKFLESVSLENSTMYTIRTKSQYHSPKE